MMTVDDVRRYFEENYQALADMITPALRNKFPKNPERQEDVRINAIDMAYCYCLGLAEGGQIPNPAVLKARAQTSTWFGVAQTLAGRMPHDRSDRAARKWGDVMDKAKREELNAHNLWTTGRDPAAEAALNTDYADFLLTLSTLDKVMIFDMIMGEKTGVMAERYGLSQGRISQLRRKLVELWHDFTSH